MTKKKKKSRYKKKRLTKKDRIAMRERRKENEKKRIQKALEKTIEAMAPSNIVVSFEPVPGKKKEPYQEIKKFFVRHCSQRVAPKSRNRDDKAYAFDTMRSAIENVFGGVRVSKNTFFIPGSEKANAAVTDMVGGLQTWDVFVNRCSIGESRQYENKLIDVIKDAKMEFRNRVANQPVSGEYASIVGIRWVSDKIRYLRRLCDAMGSRRAHDALAGLCKSRDEYAANGGYNLPMYCEIQKTLAESFDMRWQEEQVARWTNWRGGDADILKMKTGTMAQAKIERRALKLLDGMRAYLEDPTEDNLYEVNKQKMRVLTCADSSILPNYGTKQKHPHKFEDEEMWMFFPKDG